MSTETENPTPKESIPKERHNPRDMKSEDGKREIESDIAREYGPKSTDIPSRGEGGNFEIGERVEIIKPGSRFNDKKMQQSVNETLPEGTAKYDWDEKPLRSNQFGTVVNHFPHPHKQNLTVHVVHLDGSYDTNIHVLIHPDGLTPSLWLGQLVYIFKEGSKYSPTEGFAEHLPSIPEDKWVPFSDGIQNKPGRIVSILRHHTFTSDVYLVKLDLGGESPRFALLKGNGLRDYAQIPAYLKPKKPLFEFRKKPEIISVPGRVSNKVGITLGTLPCPPKGRGIPVVPRPAVAEKPKPLQLGTVKPLTTPHPAKYSTAAGKSQVAVPPPPSTVKVPTEKARIVATGGPSAFGGSSIKGGKGTDGQSSAHAKGVPTKGGGKSGKSEKGGKKGKGAPIARRPYEGDGNEQYKRPKPSHEDAPSATRSASDAYRKYATGQSGGFGSGKGGKGIKGNTSNNRYPTSNNYAGSGYHSSSPYQQSGYHGTGQLPTSHHPTQSQGYPPSTSSAQSPASHHPTQSQGYPPSTSSGYQHQGQPYQQTGYQQSYTQAGYQAHAPSPASTTTTAQQYQDYVKQYQQTAQSQSQSQQYQQYLQSYGYGNSSGYAPPAATTGATPTAAPTASTPSTPTPGAAMNAAPGSMNDKYRQLWEEYKQKNGK
eukprot:TRINITY_DN13363_c0_g1_i1.p1 TRINITY_DN13363_c0_g1~~TRINITY_DN13363_c0_g1_i1.p1  ORF type:complete len:684 (+),score=109.05 TRINITY_DN13363_c0_g1_i1:99-2054(+)